MASSIRVYVYRNKQGVPVMNSENIIYTEQMQDLPDDQFDLVGIDESKLQAVVRPHTTYWQDALRRFVKNKVALAGFVVILLIALLAAFAPLFSKYDAYTNNLLERHMPISKEHIFGTDALGRDIWCRIWVGARVSLLIGFSAAIIESVVGVIIGGISGYLGGKADLIIMRIVEIMSAIPNMIFIILIMVIVGQGIPPLILSFAVTGWLGMARLVRGQVLHLKELEFVMVAKTMGANAGRIIFRHLIPNTIGVIIVSLTMSIPQAIFTEAFLSFIGIGVKPPTPSWGVLASDGATVLRAYPSELLIPALLICLTMLSLNLLGDGLRDALDPKMRI